MKNKHRKYTLSPKRKIINLLNDGEWHRHQDLKKNSEMSTATLQKHLKEMKGLIERKIGLQNEEYPPPVYYRIKPAITDIPEIVELAKKEQKILEDLDVFVTKGRKLRGYLVTLNTHQSLSFINFLEVFFKNPDGLLPEENKTLFSQVLEYFIIHFYRMSFKHLQLKIQELSEKGENIGQILAEAKKEIKNDFKKLKKTDPKLFAEFSAKGAKS